jgi:hypothetical protein
MTFVASRRHIFIVCDVFRRILQVIFVACVISSPSWGQSAPDQASAAGTASPTARGSSSIATPPASLDCTKKSTAQSAPPGSAKVVAALANGVIWQPQDGHVQFTLTSKDGKVPSSINNIEVVVCFGWPEKVHQSADAGLSNTLYQSNYLETVDRDSGSVTYQTVFPVGLWNDDKNAPTLSDVGADLVNRLRGRPRHLFDGLGLVPIVNMRILARTIGGPNPSADPNALDVTVPVGISFRPLALFVTTLLTLVAWALLRKWAKRRKIRGGGILLIISNRNGYASLSQFQILLWTFVIGAGAVYVMVLSGSLITIPDQALALLGISGFSALSAAIKSNQTSENAVTPQTAPPTPAPPVQAGVVHDLQALNSGGAGVDALLVWQPPEGGLMPGGYSLTWSPASAVPAQGQPAPTQQPLKVDGPSAMITGLTSGTRYDFSVTTLGISGANSEPITVALTAGAAATAPTTPVSDFEAKVPGGGISVALSWSNDKAVDRYLVQYRRAGNKEWLTHPDTVLGGYTLTGIRTVVLNSLDAATFYEFRVAKIVNDQLGPWSGVVAATTGRRTPSWSDLVVWDGIGEIEITRVQMLTFTALAAMFVVINIVDESRIPDIPNSIVLLMGLSNGLYVGGKFVGATK